MKETLPATICSSIRETMQDYTQVPIRESFLEPDGWPVWNNVRHSVWEPTKGGVLRSIAIFMKDILVQ